MNGSGMTWQEAEVFARAGWGVRRHGWRTGDGDSGSALRWILFHNQLFFLLYTETGTGATVARVVEADDFTADEFLARDWTVHPPDCYITPDAVRIFEGYPGDQFSALQGRDPLNPNSVFGPCGDEPPSLLPDAPQESLDQDPPPMVLPALPAPLAAIWAQNAPLPGPPPGAPGFGGGGGGGGGGRAPRKAKPRKEKPTPPVCGFVVNRTAPAGGCHWWYDPDGYATETFSGNFTLGASADPRLQSGNWWATITASALGLHYRATDIVSLNSIGVLWGPLNVKVVPCYSRITFNLLLHHPPTGTQCRARTTLTTLGMCGSASCPIPPP